MRSGPTPATAGARAAPAPRPRRGALPADRAVSASASAASPPSSDISLEVVEGEFVCFLGPSGCGKTTLLRAIAGLDIQSSGRILQAGRDISALPPDQRDFGIVFQSYALFPNLTVARNVAYGLENRRAPRAEIERRVDELLRARRARRARPQVPGAALRRPAAARGARARARDLARPAAARRAARRRSTPRSACTCATRSSELQRRLGVTTIMVTHDQEEALTMADRIVVMNHGVIEQVGTPLEIYREPQDRLRRRLHRHA